MLAIVCIKLYVTDQGYVYSCVLQRDTTLAEIIITQSTYEILRDILRVPICPEEELDN